MRSLRKHLHDSRCDSVVQDLNAGSQLRRNGGRQEERFESWSATMECEERIDSCVYHFSERTLCDVPFEHGAVHVLKRLSVTAKSFSTTKTSINFSAIVPFKASPT